MAIRPWLYPLISNSIRVPYACPGSHHSQKNRVIQALEEAQTRPDMDKDAMDRAIIFAVVDEYLSYRSVRDVTHELLYAIESMDDDKSVVTRGC